MMNDNDPYLELTLYRTQECATNALTEGPR